MQRREYHLKGDVGPPPSTANGGAVAATMTTMTMTLNGEAPTLATIEGIQPKLAVESSSLLVAPASVVIALQPGACSAAKTKTDDEMTHAADTADTAAAAGCSCANASLCRPLDTPHPLHETFVAMIHERTVPYLNYSVPTTLFIGPTLGTAMLDPAVICAAHAHGVRVVTSVGVGAGLLGSIKVADIANAKARKEWIHRIMYGNSSDTSAGIVQAGLDGVMFDIERYDGNATQLTLLVSELAAALKGWNPWNQLSFALSVFPHSQAQFYDHLAISRLVDYVFVMAYDEWPYEAFPHKTSTAAANSDLRALNHTVAEYESIGVSPAKLVIGLPWYGNDFLCDDGNRTGASAPAPGSPCSVVPHSRTPIKERAVLDQLKRMDQTPLLMIDNASVSVYFDYQCTNLSRECPSGQPNVNNTKHGRHQIWYDTVDTLREKYQACHTLGLRGVGVFAVDFVDYTSAQGTDNWEVLASVWPRGPSAARVQSPPLQQQQHNTRLTRANMKLDDVAGCSDDDDCNLNGVCGAGQCTCAPEWIGADCGVLNLAPARVHGAGLMTPVSSSWGGSLIFVDGVHHMFASRMVGHCGLDEWGSNSEVIHATSLDGEGPYVVNRTVVPHFAHGPEIRRAATGFVLMHLGCGGGAGHAKNCTPPSDRLTLPPKGKPPPGPRCYGHCSVSIKTSASIYGPWSNSTQVYLNSTRATPWFQDPHHKGFTNPAPYIYPNGSVLLAYRANGQNINGSGQAEHVSVATAPSIHGPFLDSRLHPAIIEGSEDPFIWQDERGHFHMLMHGPPKAGGPKHPRGGGKLVGAHAFSRDSITWNESTTPPYTSLVKFNNGSSFDMRRRERPQLLLSDSGQPRLFSTGVEDFGEHTWTLVMRVNAQKNDDDAS